MSLACLCHAEGCDVWILVRFGLFEGQNGNSCRAATRCIWVVTFLCKIPSTFTLSYEVWFVAVGHVVGEIRGQTRL